MKKILLLSVLLSLTGCASRGDVLQHYSSPAQTYRDKGEGKTIEVTGDLNRLAESALGGFYSVLTVFFDHEQVMTGRLNPDETGEVYGKWREKPVSASCSARKVSKDWIENKCIVFVDNERTVTLTF